jgi:hypothetical protein
VASVLVGGRGGFLLRRAYGDDITPFLENLRQERRAHIDALAALDLPVPEFADD